MRCDFFCFTSQTAFKVTSRFHFSISNSVFRYYLARSPLSQLLFHQLELGFSFDLRSVFWKAFFHYQVWFFFSFCRRNVINCRGENFFSFIVVVENVSRYRMIEYLLHIRSDKLLYYGVELFTFFRRKFCNRKISISY